MTAPEAYLSVQLEAESDIDATPADRDMHYRNEELERQVLIVMGAWKALLPFALAAGEQLEFPTEWRRRMDAKINGKVAA